MLVSCQIRSPSWRQDYGKGGGKSQKQEEKKPTEPRTVGERTRLTGMVRSSAAVPAPAGPSPGTRASESDSDSLPHGPKAHLTAPSPHRPACRGPRPRPRHSPGRRGYSDNLPGWPRSARRRNSSSLTAAAAGATTHHPPLPPPPTRERNTDTGEGGGVLVVGTVEEEAAGPPALPTHPPAAAAAASSPRRPAPSRPGPRAGGGRAVPRSPRWPDCGRRGVRGRSSVSGGQRGCVPLPQEK